MTGEDKGMHIDTVYLWRADVDNPSSEGYISVQAVTTAGDIEITALTYMTTADPIAQV